MKQSLKRILGTILLVGAIVGMIPAMAPCHIIAAERKAKIEKPEKAKKKKSKKKDKKARSENTEITENADSQEKAGKSEKSGKAMSDRYDHISKAEFDKVAKRLGVEVAAIKAVVAIEAGPGMKGFWAPGAPVVNFDASMYSRFKNKVENQKGNKSVKVPSGLSGPHQKAWQRLVNAMHNNEEGAMMGTFWGMFQIGGFNYKKCGCKSVKEFVKRMSESEDEQLELFATFIETSGMVKDLRARNWAGFARQYNGSSYASRGYHTKMASAYAKFKREE